MITASVLFDTRWADIVRLARHLGVKVPSCCADYGLACTEDCFLHTVARVERAASKPRKSNRKSTNLPKAI